MNDFTGVPTAERDRGGQVELHLPTAPEQDAHSLPEYQGPNAQECARPEMLFFYCKLLPLIKPRFCSILS